jgi:hypothetical protein
MNPYNLCVLDSPRNLKAESPSKYCVSGTVPLAASRLNQPLLAIARQNFEKGGIGELFEPNVDVRDCYYCCANNL